MYKRQVCHRPNFTIKNFEPGTYGLRCYADGSRTAFYSRADRVRVHADGSSWSWTSDNTCGAATSIDQMKIELYGGPSGTRASHWYPW